MTIGERPDDRSAPRAPGGFYRPELDVLRFIAFLMVFLHHTLPKKGVLTYLGPGLSVFAVSFAKACGFGLSLFFALSAYLITELLVRERTVNGRLAIKAFYIRRVLRIWPLYFLGLAIGVTWALLKGIPGVVERYAAYAVLAGNWYCATHLASVGTSPMEILWSISVEEQFYLFWPWVAARTRKVLLIASVALISSSSVALVAIAGAGGSTDVAWFNSFVQFGSFGAGTLLSLMLKGSLPRWGAMRRMSAAIAAVVLWFMASHMFHIKDAGPATSSTDLVIGYLAVELGCVLALLSVIGISSSKVPRPLIYLGRMSFGLYVFHVLGVHIASALSHRMRITHPEFVEPVFGLAIAIAFASLSYRFYETPFLKFKKRLEIIESRPV